MSFLIDTIDSSGLFAQSANSASVATYDSNGNVITATYLTGVDLTPYQTTAGMTAYATTGDVSNKLDTTAFSDVSGTFLTAHQSLDGYATTAWVDSQGYLTAHQPISADEWNNVYDTVNVYSGSWTGSESSPTASVDSNGSIDIVSSNNTVYFDVNGTWFNNAVNSALPTSAAQWNSNYDTVNTNSGVWGGSALNISAGEGVKVTLVNNNLVFSNDETVLWESPNGLSTSAKMYLSEHPSAFNAIDFYCKSWERMEIIRRQYYSASPGGIAQMGVVWKQDNSNAICVFGFNYTYNSDDNSIQEVAKGMNTLNGSTLAYTNYDKNVNIGITKIVGINRINNV